MKALILAGLLLGTAAPALAQEANSAPIPVKLDLYDGDKYSHAFSDGVRAAIGGDSRFQLVDKLPPEGLKISVDDAISYDADNGAETAAYAVSLKLGSGKFVTKSSGYCDVKRWDMCGRVVAQDVYDAYQAYMAAHGG